MSKVTFMRNSIAGIVLLLASALANATIFTGEVDSDAFITQGAYDLAWASPCADGALESSCGAIDLSEQSGYGWNVMTEALFSSLGLSAATFEVGYSSSNTQSYGGKNYAKATGWFSNQYTHIDVQDGIAGRWAFLDTADTAWYETIVYRSVPAPVTLVLFGLGLLLMSLQRRRSVR